MNISIEERYLAIKKEISELEKVSISQKPVTLIAVSKTQKPDQIEEIYRLGQRDFGENYVQELLEKDRVLKSRGIDDIIWHFIGHLQTNKVKSLAGVVKYIHTVDSFALANEIAKRWREQKKSIPIPVFIEVNLHSESTKSGIDPLSVPSFAKQLLDFTELEVSGLMCVPNPSSNPQESFVQLRELELSCRPMTQGMLSMGMSNDYVSAIQEGATHVRVGTAIFGARPLKR